MILPKIEICDDGVFWMFHSRFAETERQGGSGHCHFSWSFAWPRCFSFITDILAFSTSP